jgi:hypothetical protein
VDILYHFNTVKIPTVAKLEYKGMNLVTIKELKTPLFEELKAYNIN